MQEIFDLFIEELNDNTDSLVYDGNYIFKFHESGLQLLTAVTGTLVKEEIPYSPVGLITAQPVVFVEKSKQVDWAIQIGILSRISGQTYDDTVDLDWANIVTACSTLNGSSQTTTTKRYSYKVSPPDYQGYQVLGKSKYMLVIVTMNVTETLIAYEFSQNSVFKIDSEEFDWVEILINATKRFYTSDNKTTTTNDYNKPIGRAQIFTVTFNYNNTSTTQYKMYKESRSQQTLSSTYSLTETTSKGDTFTWTVAVRSGSEVYKRNSTRKLTLELVEVV